MRRSSNSANRNSSRIIFPQLEKLGMDEGEYIVDRPRMGEPEGVLLD